MTSWTTFPFAVHVAASPAIAESLALEATAAGATVIRINLVGVDSRLALVERLKETFALPPQVPGLDAMISLISDDEWLTASGGYLVIIEGMDRAPLVANDMAVILPNILDRWRSQEKPFVVVLVGTLHRDEATSALEMSNQKLAEAGRLPWVHPGTGPVTVIDHLGDLTPGM